MKAPVILVLACGKNGQIGLQNGLPWNLPEDLKHFKELTSGHAVIQGRLTFESIGRPLPGRQNIVISSQLRYLPGVTVAQSLTEAIEKVEECRKAYIIGGVGVWMEALPIADSVIISEVDYDGEVDVYLPEKFKELLSQRYRLNNLRPKTGFTLSEWLRGTVKP
jgi:dihydrofolate reductase